jgi:hypothetical protein
MSQLEDLKKEKESWEEYVKNNRKLMNESKIKVRATEHTLRLAKKEYNFRNKQWVYCRKQVLKTDRKIHSLPSRLRKYTRDNPGKTLKNLGIIE